MNFRIKDPKQVVLHASGGSGAGFIDGVWHGQPPKRDLTCVCGAVWEGETMVHPPQKKEWVGLTDEEIAEIAATPAAIPGSYVHSFACAIEAKLKEKNT